MHRLLTAAAALALLAGTAGTALADYWGKPACDFYKDTGRVICSTSQSMSGGKTGGRQVLTLYIMRESGGEPYASVGIFDDAWAMPRRGDLQALIGLDARTPIKVPARTNNTLVLIDLPLEALPALQRAGVIHITLPTFTESYNLAGSRRAIEALAGAYGDYTGRGRSTSDPFAGAQPKAPPATRAADPFTPVVRRST